MENNIIITSLSIINDVEVLKLFISRLPILTNNYNDNELLTPTKSSQPIIQDYNIELPLLIWEDGDHITSKSLTHLTLSNLRIHHNNEILAPFTNIAHLNLSFNRIEGDLIGISHLILLKHLDISHNKIKKLDDIKLLTNLEILRFHNNSIDSLEFITRLDNLKELWISNNNINWTDVLYLNNLVNLTKLVKSPNPFDDKPKLTEFIFSTVCINIFYFAYLYIILLLYFNYYYIFLFLNRFHHFML
jgi:Leucine-rich repeat (LRR) protein